MSADIIQFPPLSRRADTQSASGPSPLADRRGASANPINADVRSAIYAALIRETVK